MTRTNKLMLVAAALTLAASGAALGKDHKVMLSGKNEVPPVNTTASGEGTITVADDGAVSGSVMTKGVKGTAAHIHQAAEGKNGGVVVPLTKDGDTYKVPAGAKLNADQMKAYKAGELYVNVHSDANKDGELRAQIK